MITWSGSLFLQLIIRFCLNHVSKNCAKQKLKHSMCGITIEERNNKKAFARKKSR